jgi:hypothetical protein
MILNEINRFTIFFFFTPFALVLGFLLIFLQSDLLAASTTP